MKRRRKPLSSPKGRVVWMHVTAAGWRAAYETERAAEAARAMRNDGFTYPVVVDQEDA